ncbi:MAG: hypothetical protein LBF22_15565 [Deltaproteobacteria bacterium]|nr:hypothetical protein [Deltaproteobacteria bacterium]
MDGGKSLGALSRIYLRPFNQNTPTSGPTASIGGSISHSMGARTKG